MLAEIHTDPSAPPVVRIYETGAVGQVARQVFAVNYATYAGHPYPLDLRLELDRIGAAARALVANGYSVEGMWSATAPNYIGAPVAQAHPATFTAPDPAEAVALSASVDDADLCAGCDHTAADHDVDTGECYGTTLRDGLGETPCACAGLAPLAPVLDPAAVAEVFAELERPRVAERLAHEARHAAEPVTAVEAEVREARRRAHAKHGVNSIEAVQAWSPRWLAILVEEVGEVAHVLTYDGVPTGADPATELRAELVDVLAVASAWVDALDRGPAGGAAMVVA